jgi:hypothetical protein
MYSSEPEGPIMSDEIRDAAPDWAYDSRPVWQSVIELGESLPPEVWNGVPNDLSANLDHYLYGKQRV